MQAGSLTNRIKLYALQSGVDAIGQPVDVWTEVATLWANIKHLNGVQAIKSDADTSIVKASIRIRKNTSVNAGMRVIYGTTVYQIDAVLQDEAGKQYTDLACKVVE
jgi:SPP1 family predicted phage head-tail adaptor